MKIVRNRTLYNIIVSSIIRNGLCRSIQGFPDRVRVVAVVVARSRHGATIIEIYILVCRVLFDIRFVRKQNTADNRIIGDKLCRRVSDILFIF